MSDKIRHNLFHHLVFFIMREKLVFKMRNDLTATWSVALLCLCVCMYVCFNQSFSLIRYKLTEGD